MSAQQFAHESNMNEACSDVGNPDFHEHQIDNKFMVIDDDNKIIGFEDDKDSLINEPINKC